VNTIDIIQFPTQAVRDKTSLIRTLSSMFKEAGVDETTRDQLVDHLVGIWERHQADYRCEISFPLPAGISDEERSEFAATIERNVNGAISEFREHCAQLLVELLLAEMRLYLATQ